MRKLVIFVALAGVMALTGAACNELNEPLPTAPSPLPPPPPSQFRIAGHWEALTDQGRRIAFDVSSDGMVVNGRINVHHDCTTGRLRMTIDGYEGPVRNDSFLATMNYRIDDAGNIYVGKVTVSGQFEADDRVRGGFVNSVTEKPPNDAFGVCLAADGTFQGQKE
jgi:hypothetical protein